MPTIGATIPKELDEQIEKAIPKYGNKSATIALLIDEAIQMRKIPLESQLISFYKYMRSHERIDDMRTSALWDESKAHEILDRVYPFDIANWKAMVADDGYAFL